MRKKGWVGGRGSEAGCAITYLSSKLSSILYPISVIPTKHALPYRGKFWRGENLANLAIRYKLAKVFPASDSSLVSESNHWLGLNSSKFIYSACYLPKFSPTKVSSCTVALCNAIIPPKNILIQKNVIL